MKRFHKNSRRIENEVFILYMPDHELVTAANLRKVPIVSIFWLPWHVQNENFILDSTRIFMKAFHLLLFHGSFIFFSSQTHTCLFCLSKRVWWCVPDD
jgi:hypothetical protein